MFGISAFSESPYSSLAGKTLIGSGSISATATLTTDGFRIRLGDASVNGQATVSVEASSSTVTGNASISGIANLQAIGGFIVDSSGSINGFATLTADANAILAGNASISATATVIADGHIQGNNWTVVPVTLNTWKRIG
jgi:hypothetical protein